MSRLPHTAARELARQRQKRSSFYNNLLGYGTITVIVGLLSAFLIVPVGVVVARAFTTENGIGLDYFRLLFASDNYVDAIANSFLLAICTTLISTIVSLPLALASAKWEFRGKGILSGLILLPMVMPPFVGAIGMQRLLARRGSINLVLMDWGITTTPIEWLSGNAVFWVVVALEVLHLYPIMYLNLSAALANIDPSMEEMAETLGVPRWRRYRDIVWPLAKPGFFAGAIIVFVWALTDLGTPLLSGYHETLPVRIFNLVTDANENPLGFALVFVVILATVGIFLFSRIYVNGKKYQMLARGHVAGGNKRASTLGTLGIWALFLLVSGLALVPHAGVLIASISDKWFMTPLPEFYTTEHYFKVFQTELSLNGIKNSLGLAALATFADLILGIVIAYVVVRKLVPLSSLLDSLVMIPLALPGIVLAFGYVVTYSGTFLDPLNNPIPLLVIAYAIRRLPYMVRSASAGLEQTHISLEEASMSFGASRFHTLRKITVPLVTANLIAGGLLCFAYAMLDVSDSLILAMKDRYYPMTKAIYVLFLEQGTGDLVASALGMIGMLILMACIMGASAILGKKMGELFRS